jgi:hypothetical protein
VVDPYRQYFSPYSALENNPTVMIDQTGGYSEKGAKWRHSLASLMGKNPGEIYESGGEYGFNIPIEDGVAFMFGKLEKASFWDHPIVRAQIGDYLFGSLDLTVIPGLGGKETPFGLVMPLRGPDAFKLKIFHDIGYGAGVDVSASFNLGKGWLLGPPSEVTLANFSGPRYQADGGIGNLGLGITYAPAPSGANHFGVVLINGSFSLGATPISGNLNYGKTWYP